MAKTEIDISVALAAYRGGKFFEQQLISLAEQTRIPDEVVITDDGGKLATEQTVDAMRKRFPGIEWRYYRNEEQLGVVANFAKAIALTKGQTILLSDEDDIWLPPKVEMLTEAAQKKGAAFCNSICVNESLERLGFTHWDLRGFPELAKRQLNTAELRNLFFVRVPAAGHNMAFQAKFRDLLLPFPELKNCHDTWIGVMLAIGGYWTMVPQELTLYRIHGDNVSAPKAARGWEKFRMAKESIRNNTFAWQADLYEAALTRWKERGEAVAADVAASAAERIEFCRMRATLNKVLLRRIVPIWKEWRSGHYHKYGRGVENIIQDLFLRTWW